MPRRPTVKERSQPLPRPPELLEPALIRLCKDPQSRPIDVLGAVRSPEAFEAIDARDAQGRTALHWATYQRNAPVVEQLLHLGAHPDLPDQAGQTPLHLVAWYGDLRSDPARLVAQHLSSYLADPDLPDAQGHTPRTIAERLGTQALLACLRTPQDLAARMRTFVTETRPDQFEESIRRCLTRGVDPNGRTPEGRSWLGEAAGRGASRVVDLLLAHGASPHDADAKGMTPLHRGAAYGVISVIESLLAASPHVDRLDHEGRTPLWLAVQSDRPWAVQRLLQAGADPTRPNRAQESPWALAHRLQNDSPMYNLTAMVDVLRPALVDWERARLHEQMPASQDTGPFPSLTPLTRSRL